MFISRTAGLFSSPVYQANGLIVFVTYIRSSGDVGGRVPRVLLDVGGGVKGLSYTLKGK